MVGVIMCAPAVKYKPPDVATFVGTYIQNLDAKMTVAACGTEMVDRIP